MIVLGNVKVAEGGNVGAEMKTTKVFNHVVAKPKAVVELTKLAAQPWTSVSYQISPATPATELGEGATEADKALLVAGGYSIYVEGKATKGAETKSFKWGFTTKTLFERCKGDSSGKEVDGVVVTSGGTDAVELTIHGDHFFYDDLQSPEAKLRFQNPADADADKNGEVPWRSSRRPSSRASRRRTAPTAPAPRPISWISRPTRRASAAPRGTSAARASAWRGRSDVTASAA